MRGIEKMKVSQHKNLANNTVRKAVSGQMKPYFKALRIIKIKKRRKKEMSQGMLKVSYSGMLLTMREEIFIQVD